MAKEHNRKIALMFVMLIMGLLAGSVSAATIEEEFVVSKGKSVSIEFPVEETGTIYAEIVEFTGYYTGLGIVLELPSGKTREVWWNEFSEMPLSLTYVVSKEDIETEKDWKMSVVQRYSRGNGTLKITYPSDTTPPTIAITCSPEKPTADQQITFIATASDRSGIHRIKILVNAEKVEECFDSGSCTHIGGPYPAGTSVSYHAKAYDKTGNEVETVHKLVHISEARDITPPTVIESTPTGENVPVTTQITVTFSEPMNKESVESASSYIYPEVSGELYWEDNTIIFTPSSNLNYDTRYVAGIKGGDRGAMDLAGNVMEESYEWDFETVSPELIPPTAIISATPREINEGESVSFSAEASSDQDGYIVSYYWDFGDGDNDTGINVEHTYSHSGHYTATLTVTDNDVLSTRDRVEITVNTLITPNIPPTAYNIDIYPNPAGEGERVTFEGYGEDEDGEVVECRWTFPDGTTFSDSGSSSSVTLEPEDVHAGWYSFAVRDDEEAWSEEVGVELELETPPDIPWIWILPAIVLVIAAALIIRNRIDEDRKKRGKGSIDVDSNPQNALVFLDEVYSGLSPATVPEVPVGAHLVKFRKFGYFDCEREAMVNANQTTHVHCDLTEIPEIKLKLSAEPTEIPADGKSESTITIRIEDNNEIPIPVPEDVTVELKTNAGTVESPVKIPAGPALVTTTLTSSTAEGTATVEAKALFLKGSTTVEFLQSA